MRALLLRSDYPQTGVAHLHSIFTNPTSSPKDVVDDENMLPDEQIRALLAFTSSSPPHQTAVRAAFFEPCTVGVERDAPRPWRSICLSSPNSTFPPSAGAVSTMPVSAVVVCRDSVHWRYGGALSNAVVAAASVLLPKPEFTATANTIPHNLRIEFVFGAVFAVVE
ncbi:hypothetical protein GGF32_001206 [Allomyces javanicus]|nr:hypothetical protein GGF32_001206 [Allomyces javanicus]